MNELSPTPDSRLDDLFALARSRHPDTSAVEFAFETRLMARLRARRDHGTVWSMVSWRLIPFFGACVVALFLWQSEVASETSDALALTGLENPVAVELWSN
jgi:hypothetical protein